jgi:hypothetical protein
MLYPDATVNTWEHLVWNILGQLQRRWCPRNRVQDDSIGVRKGR